nr:hypothetical protein [Paenibacillus taihuensis]
MTRSFADDTTGIVGEDVVAYYKRRAQDGIGLIITEGITPSVPKRQRNLWSSWPVYTRTGEWVA